MSSPLDIRQSIYRYTLNHLAPGPNHLADELLESIHSELLPPYRLIVTEPESLVITVEGRDVQNPSTLTYHTAVPVGGYNQPDFYSETITFPASNGGNIAASTGASVPLSVSDGFFKKVLVCIDMLGDIVLKLSKEADTVANVKLPSIPNATYPVGYLVASNIGGNIQNISGNKVYRFSGVTHPVNRNNTGFNSWTSGIGSYWTIVGDTFQVDRGGDGFINGTYVEWEAGLQTGSLPVNTTTFVCVDSEGAIYTAYGPSESLYQNYIVLYEVLNDGVNIVVTKENHPYNVETSISRFLHSALGTLIAGDGAIVEKVTSGSGSVPSDREVKISGAAAIEDHGLVGNIPDSLGSGVTWYQYYKNSAGKWVTNAVDSEFQMVYNNAGTISPLNSSAPGNVAIASLYVIKDNLEGFPTYIAVIDSIPYNSTNEALNAIENSNYDIPTNELKALEPAKLGHVVLENNVTGGTVAFAISKKDSVHASSVGSLPSINDHGAMNGLADDDHLQYLLLAGRTGGQIARGGISSGNSLILRSTTHSTKGQVYVDETTASSSSTTGAFRVAGGVGIGGNLYVGSSIFVPNAGRFDTSGNQLYIGSVNATSIQIGNVSSTTTVLGNLIVQGTTTSVNTTVMDVKDNQIFINSGETGAGVSAGKAGMLVDRGSLTDYEFVFDEVSDTFRVGEVSLTQAVATRQDAPASSGIPYWNGAMWRFDTQADFYFETATSTIFAKTLRCTGVTALRLPVGVTGDRPTGVSGLIRQNSTLGLPEYYEPGTTSWQTFASQTYATSVAITYSIVFG
jgi:hypothetical protein